MSNKTARIMDALANRSTSGDGASARGDDRLSEADRANIEETVKHAVEEALEEHDRQTEERASETEASESSSGRSRKKMLVGGLALASAAYAARRWRGGSGADAESDQSGGHEFESSDADAASTSEATDSS